MRPERGFALVAALFVMVVIGLAVAAMSRLSVTQTASVDLLLQQARAYQAARAGLEWGVARVLGAPSCTPGVPGEDTFTAGTAWVTVRCTATGPVSLPEEGQAAVIFYQLEATAEVGSSGSTDYAWRRLTATVERAAP